MNGLKVGDKVFIREDLIHLQEYGNAVYYKAKGSGKRTIAWFYNNNKKDTFAAMENGCYYTAEMIDWEKKRKIREIDFKEIIQYGECGNETTKAIGYDLREITVKNNGEENDIEKAVMLLMLKQHGFTYGEVKREVEKVKIKWIPKQGEKYYWISSYLEIKWYSWEGLCVDRDLFKCGNCFKTREEAEKKLEKIKEVLRGE